jgi:hypothetical protein
MSTQPLNAPALLRATQVGPLTDTEIQALRQDMAEASIRMQTELTRRREARNPAGSQNPKK